MSGSMAFVKLSNRSPAHGPSSLPDYHLWSKSDIGLTPLQVLSTIFSGGARWTQSLECKIALGAMRNLFFGEDTDEAIRSLFPGYVLRWTNSVEGFVSDTCIRSCSGVGRTDVEVSPCPISKDGMPENITRVLEFAWPQTLGPDESTTLCPVLVGLPIPTAVMKFMIPREFDGARSRFPIGGE